MTGDGPAVSELVRQMQEMEHRLTEIMRYLQGNESWGQQGLVTKVDSLTNQIEDHRRMIEAIREEQNEEEERRQASQRRTEDAQKRNERFLALISGGVVTIIVSVIVAVLTNVLGF